MFTDALQLVPTSACLPSKRRLSSQWFLAPVVFVRFGFSRLFVLAMFLMPFFLSMSTYDASRVKGQGPALQGLLSAKEQPESAARGDVCGAASWLAGPLLHLYKKPCTT